MRGTVTSLCPVTLLVYQMVGVAAIAVVGAAAIAVVGAAAAVVVAVWVMTKEVEVPARQLILTSATFLSSVAQV